MPRRYEGKPSNKNGAIYKTPRDCQRDIEDTLNENQYLQMGVPILAERFGCRIDTNNNELTEFILDSEDGKLVCRTTEGEVSLTGTIQMLSIGFTLKGSASTNPLGKLCLISSEQQ